MADSWTVFSRDQTDYQYNPIQWTRRTPREELLALHIERTTTASDAYRESVGDGRSSLEFGDGELAGTIDVVRPNGLPDDAPVVVYIHGGWWQWFSKEQFSCVAEPFNARGYAVYLPGYRLAQEWTNGRGMESIVAQMESATAAIIRDAAARGAPAVHVMGHSAGGHLVALLHRTDWSRFDLPEPFAGGPNSFASLAGLFDLRPLVDSYINDEIGMSIEEATAVSPQFLPDSRTSNAPLQLVLPEFDTAEFFRQTKEYQRKLQDLQLEVGLHVAAGRDHVDMIERLSAPGDELFEWLIDEIETAMRSDKVVEREVREASRDWIAQFNAGCVEACVSRYEPGATMRATPMGEFVGRAAIRNFWSEFVASTGACDLEYFDVDVKVLGRREAELSARWRMNVGRGVITRERWIRNADGTWRLREDDFEVTERIHDDRA